MTVKQAGPMCVIALLLALGAPHAVTASKEIPVREGWTPFAVAAGYSDVAMSEPAKAGVSCDIIVHDVMRRSRWKPRIDLDLKRGAAGVRLRGEVQRRKSISFFFQIPEGSQRIEPDGKLGQAFKLSMQWGEEGKVRFAVGHESGTLRRGVYEVPGFKPDTVSLVPSGVTGAYRCSSA